MTEKNESDEDLHKTLANYNEGAPQRHRAEFELHRRAAERAGIRTLLWTYVAA